VSTTFSNRLPRYALERAYAATIDDGLYWMRDWHTKDGQYTWMGASDADRRRAVRHWLWLRWRHAAVIDARGPLLDVPSPEMIAKAVAIPRTHPRARQGDE